MQINGLGIERERGALAARAGKKISALKELEPARLNGFSNTRLHSRRSPEHDREFMTW
jgi:hypothetical protein